MRLTIRNPPVRNTQGLRCKAAASGERVRGERRGDGMEFGRRERVADVIENPVARHIATQAAQLFALRGYDATSVREIVEAAGVTKPTLYHHFGSKEGLAKALLYDPLNDFVARMTHIQRKDEPPLERLVQMMAEHFAFCREDPDRFRFFYALLFGPVRSKIAEQLCQDGEKIVRILRQTIAELTPVSPDPQPLAEETVEDILIAMRGLFAVTTIDYIYENRPMDDAAARRLVESVIRGFLVNAANAPGNGVG